MRGNLRLPRFLAALVLVAATAAVSSADTRNIRFRHLTLEDGLPVAGIHAILQDRDGLIWLGTQGGLSRYDGYTLTNFQHDPADSASLSHDFVWTLLEDRHGVLWVGTDGGGLSRFDEVTDGFSHFRRDPDDEATLSGDRVRVLLEDRGGMIWVGTQRSGLNRFDPESGLFTRFLYDAENENSLGANRVRDLVEDRLGKLWIATEGGGLNVLDPLTGIVTRLRHDPDNPVSLSSDRVRSVFEDGSGVIWVGTYDRGLNRLDPASLEFERFTTDPSDPSRLGDALIRDIYEDSSGTLWLATDGGLAEWNENDRTFRHYRNDAVDPYSLSDDRVTALFEDRGGVLWVGTYNGLNTWNTATGYFLHYARRSDKATELTTGYVTSFAEDPDGSIWVGTLSGLNRLNRDSGRFESFRSRPGDRASLSDDRVMSLVVDHEGTLWAGTRAGGLNRRDPATGEFERFQHDPEDPASLAWDGVTSLLEDRRGALWVGTIKGGLHRYDPSRGGFVHYRHLPADPTSLSSDRVTALHEDQDGRLWVGTEDAGLNRLDRQSGAFERFRHDPGDPTSLSGDEIMALRGDAADALWIGTRGSGLNRWGATDRRAGRRAMTRYTRDEGLRSNIVFGILAGAPGEMWISGDRGLARLDSASGAISHYDTSHGLQSLDFNFGAAMRSRDDNLFFGGVNGFNVFDPARVRLNPHRPQVVLTQFLKFNRPVSFGRPLRDVEEIRLEHSDSVVAFEFAGLDYTAPTKNRYRYKLEGFDQDWIDSGVLRRVTYTNLDAGTYVFRAEASNNDGLWSEEGLALRVRVAKPPWLTWWAYCGYGLVLFGVVAGVARSIETKRQHALALEGVNASLKREIRERLAKEVALQAEKRKARQYLDVAEVIMVALDDRGEVTLINQKGCRVLGYGEEEIVGQDWVERFVPETSRAEVRVRLGDIGQYQYYEYPLVTRGGEQRTIAWHSTRFAPGTDGGQVTLSSGSDVTQIRALEKQVRMSQKMEALGTLAGGIAHDFNNILTAVYGYSTLTLDALPKASAEAAHLEQVVKASERARDLVARILTFSRKDERPKKPVALGPVILEACELLRSSLPRTIEFRAAIDTDCGAVVADPGQVHQIVMNLGTNAAHAVEPGGMLEIRYTAAEEPYIDRHVDDGETDWVRLTVRDTGHGMDTATQEKIFDPFFTTKRLGSGTGLGLSIVHGIVKSHRGRINVSSKVGLGTTVVVELPVTKELPASAERRETRATGSERILFVDDEKAIVRLASISLEASGYEVDAYTSGREALVRFRRDPGRFSLLVTDQLMPEMTGSELIEEVRRLRPDLPVVIASGTRRSERAQESPCSFLQKPFSPAEISRIVRRTLDESVFETSVD